MWRLDLSSINSIFILRRPERFSGFPSLSESSAWMLLSATIVRSCFADASYPGAAIWGCARPVENCPKWSIFRRKTRKKAKEGEKKGRAKKTRKKRQVKKKEKISFFSGAVVLLPYSRLDHVASDYYHEVIWQQIHTFSLSFTPRLVLRQDCQETGIVIILLNLSSQFCGTGLFSDWLAKILFAQGNNCFAPGTFFFSLRPTLSVSG